MVIGWRISLIYFFFLPRDFFFLIKIYLIEIYIISQCSSETTDFSLVTYTRLLQSFTSFEPFSYNRNHVYIQVGLE